MEKIEINEENYQKYQEFLDIKNGNVLGNHPFLWGTAIIFGCFVILCVGMTGTVIVLKNFIDFLTVINANGTLWGAIGTDLIVVGGLGITIFSICKSVTLGIPRILLKVLKKKHPEFDINLDKKEVKKELEKYYQLSKIPKDIEKKKEEHLSSYPYNFSQMTAEERLEFLNQEKEFWEQVAIQEKYRDTEEDTTGQVGIGQVKSPENGEKVKHISK